MSDETNRLAEKSTRNVLDEHVREALHRLRRRAERLPQVDAVAVIAEGRPLIEHIDLPPEE